MVEWIWIKPTFLKKEKTGEVIFYFVTTDVVERNSVFTVLVMKLIQDLSTNFFFFFTLLTAWDEIFGMQIEYILLVMETIKRSGV